MGYKVDKTLIVFDVEGVLIPKIRFLIFDVFGSISFRSFMKAVFFGLLYMVGLMSLKDALKKTYRLLEGFSFERFINLFQEVSLMPGVEYVFRELKKDGFLIALISSGLPTTCLNTLAKRLDSDFVEGVEIGVSEGCLTGEIWGDVIEKDGKANVLQRLFNNMKFHNCVVVADDRNNLSLFRLCDLKIGYNPDFMISRKADYVVKGDLSAIIKIIKSDSERGIRGSISKNTILRNVIHISGVSVPLICTYLLSRQIFALIIFLVTLLYFASENFRMIGIDIPLISNITTLAAGKSEVKEFVAAPIFYSLGIIISLLAFPEPIGYVSITVLTLGDGFASILGRKIGKKNLAINKNKTIEGSLFGLLIAFIGSMIYIDPFRSLVASATGMLFEILPLPLNDNMTIPLASGLILTALTII